jgi:hypothetical protein
MAATVEICESNGAGETITHNITNANMGSTDSVNLNAVTYPITPGANSFEKWQRIHVTNMGGSSKIDNLKVWRTGALGANCTHKTNARETVYGGAQTYAQPSATDRSATYGYTQTMPTSTPTGANLGIAGSLSGSLTVVGYSDYLVDQLQTTPSATAGSTTTKNYQYDETA